MGCPVLAVDNEADNRTGIGLVKCLFFRHIAAWPGLAVSAVCHSPLTPHTPFTTAQGFITCPKTLHLLIPVSLLSA